jgi:hypothetical protein
MPLPSRYCLLFLVSSKADNLLATPLDPLLVMTQENFAKSTYVPCVANATLFILSVSLFGWEQSQFFSHVVSENALHKGELGLQARLAPTQVHWQEYLQLSVEIGAVQVICLEVAIDEKITKRSATRLRVVWAMVYISSVVAGKRVKSAYSMWAM